VFKDNNNKKFSTLPAKTFRLTQLFQLLLILCAKHNLEHNLEEGGASKKAKYCYFCLRSYYTFKQTTTKNKIDW